MRQDVLRGSWRKSGCAGVSVDAPERCDCVSRGQLPGVIQRHEVLMPKIRCRPDLEQESLGA